MIFSTSAASAPSASASSSSSFNPFKRRARQKEGTSSSGSEGGGTPKKSQRPRTMQQGRAPDRPPPRGAPIRSRAGSATATTGMPYQAETPQRPTPTPTAATTTPAPRGAATTAATPVPLPRRTLTPLPPPSSSDPITQAHSSLTTLQSQLDHLSTHFDLNPSTLHFTPPSAPNPDPKFPSVPQNASYHSYIEDLTKLLLKLDGVDSNGDQGVRQWRKGLVAAIERESCSALKRSRRGNGRGGRRWSKR